MKRICTATLVLMLMCSGLLHAQQDTAAYRAANALQSTSERVDALEAFVRNFPDSRLITRSYDALFDLYVGQGNEAKALAAAHHSLESLPPAARMSPYNKFAWNLALNNLGLDSALVYIDRAIAMAGTSRSLSGFQDTKAYVLYRLQRFAEAEDLQRIAIKGHEHDPEYLTHLAMFEKENGKTEQGLKTLSRALYFGGEENAKQLFVSWIADAEKDPVRRDSLKEKIVMSTVHAETDSLSGAGMIAARSNAATIMADLMVDLPTARTWADAAVATLNRQSSLNDVIAFNQSLALVLSAQGQINEALAHLQQIRDLVDPYDTRFWLTLGKTYVQLGNADKAADAYLSGLIARNEPTLRDVLETLYKQKHLPLDGIDRSLDSLRQASAHLEPGHYGKATTPHGKVVLAELFTGAECGPCVSSDLAFDALSEYFPRSAVAILEYHVHIPGPDPLTTNGSWERYTWYEGQGTPTAVFDGTEFLIGGGAKTVARNRYGVYRYAIGKFESEKPGADLSVHVTIQGDSVEVDAKVAKVQQGMKSPVLHVALVEGSVEYTGANGIDRHKFVVRKLLGGADGTPLDLKKPAERFRLGIRLASVEREIKDYLDNPTSQPSWSNRRPFSGWRSRPEKLNRADLAIVVWIQDTASKKVLQAAYRAVPAALGVK